MSSSLRQLIAQLKHQRIGYTPDFLLTLFRDMCAILGFLELRDRFSLDLRRYTKYFLDRQDASMIDASSRDIQSMSLDIIDLGTLLLSYRTKRPNSDVTSSEIWTLAEIIISTISRIGKNPHYGPNLQLESRLARCVHKLNRFSQTWPELVHTKLDRLLTEWKLIPCRIDPSVNMELFFSEHVLPNEVAGFVKVSKEFGASEEVLESVYLSRGVDVERGGGVSVVGGYEFERDERAAAIIEIFFRIGFDRTENWEGLSSEVNSDFPIIGEFYEDIRHRELLEDHQCKSYLNTNQ